MAFNCITDRLRRSVLAAGAFVVAFASIAPAHEIRRPAAREIVRLQGYRSTAPPDFPAARVLVLAALGEEAKFFVTEIQAFESGGEKPGPERERYELQGERALVKRFAAARPDQRVTLLAERRPGGADLFLLAVDLCPPR